MRFFSGRIAVTAITFVSSVLIVALTDRPPVAVGTAISTESAHMSPSARSAESVRYEDDDVVLLASYPIANGGPVEADAMPARFRAAWDSAAGIIPPNDLARIRQLNIVSDGPAGTLGMVHRSTAVKDQWILSLDPAESAETLRHTMVHELAHLHTLGAGDVWKARACDAIELAIGCVRRGSALGRWHDAFWSDEREPARYRSDRFVTQYAATSVHEDLAETFMAWVLDQVPDRPALQAKAALLAELPELVELRAQLQARLPARG